MELLIEHIELQKDHDTLQGPGGSLAHMPGNTKLTVTAGAYFGGSLMALRGSEEIMHDFMSKLQPGSALLPAVYFTQGQGIFEALMRLVHEVQSLVGAVYAGKPERLPYVWDGIRQDLDQRRLEGSARILNDTQVMRLLTAILAQLDAVQTSIEKNGIPK